MEGAATVTIATLLSSIGEVFTSAIGWAGTVGSTIVNTRFCCCSAQSACRSWRWSVQASAERLTVSGGVRFSLAPHLFLY